MSDNMSHSERVRSIFDQVVDLPPTERAAALGRLCMTNNQPDAALRAEVEALLASLDAAHQAGFMSSPTAATTIRNAAITETPGTRIGPYKLLQVIGEGGFGTVFLAEQSEPVRRRVALKIIKLGMDTKQVIARFEAERQALALMDHPHIARVLDAGATPITEHGGGRPYFVMEYVVGDAITQFAANNNLDIRARLELFAQVCSAVQHAHTKGIIHRDIKPGNVLVTMTDGKPFARVIDFGIAKATASAGGLTDKTLFTEHRQLIGTPEYMSPEQAQGSPDIDTRTDVYALGVLLYELLAGDTPFDGKRLRSAAWDEMRRIIKEEDPPTPSARVTQRMKSGGSASSPSAPLTLRPSAPSDLRGELDWIVMKSLDKDRARRYETPSALAADVERHLKGEAVQAAPPSAAYRLRKFVRRNKGPVIAGSAVAAALLVGIAGTTWGMWRAEQATETVRRGAVADANAMLDALKVLTPNGNVVLERDRISWTNADGTPGFLILNTEGDWEQGITTIRPGAWLASRVATLAEDLRIETKNLEDANSVLAHQISTAKEALRNIIIETAELDSEERNAVMQSESVSEEEARKLQADAYAEGIREARQFLANERGEAVGDQSEIDILALVSWWKARELKESREHLRQQTDAAEWSAYTANLALAQAALQSGNRLEAALRLEQCPESRRGWEWNVLRASADTSAYTYQAHGPLAFLDGGDRFLTRSLNNGLEFRETSSGRLIKTIVGSFGVNDVQVSPDGEHLLLAGVDRTRNEYAAAICDVDGGSVFQTAEHDESPLTSFVANGAAFITVERFFRENSRLRVWDTKTGDMLASLEQAWPGYQWGAASPHSPHVVMCTNEFVELRDIIRNTRTAILKGLNPADLIAVEFSPDGKTILTVSRATGVELWSGESGDHVATIALESINPEEVDCVSFASNGSRAVISAYGDVAEVIDIESGAHLSTVLCQPHDVSFISRLTPDGSGLLTTGGPTPRLWDASTGRFITEFAGHVRDARFISCTPDGSVVIAAAYDGVSRAWPISTTPSPLVLRVPQDAGDSARRGEFDPTVLTAPTCLAAVPIGEGDDRVEWRGPGGEAPVGTERDGCTSVAFSKDGSRLFYTAHASIFERNLNDASDSREHCHLDLYGNYVYMGPKLIGPDDTGAFWSWRQSVQQWRPGHDKESWRITLPSIAAYDRKAQTEESIRHLSFADVSADGSRLLTVFDHGARWPKATPGRATSMPGATIWVSDARTGERIFEREIMCEAYYASAAGINADGTLLAYMEQSGDRDISRMLNIATGETHSLITEDRWKIRRHTFSPDGSRLVAVGDYGASLWNTQTGAKLASFTQRRFEAHNSHVSFNSDASRAVVVMGGTAILIDTASGEEIAELLGHTNTITSAAFSPDDSRIATASYDQSLRIWDGATGRPLTVYTEQAPTGGADGEGFPPAGFNCLAFSPDGRRLAVGAVDGRVLVFDSAQDGAK